MSDPRFTPESSQSSLGPDTGDHEDRLAAILADTSLPDRDKRQALQEALDDLQRERGDEPAAAYEPIETRFFEALSLLAEGGHDYGEAAADEDDQPGAALPGPGPVVQL